jgi:hypothetical protein
MIKSRDAGVFQMKVIVGVVVGLELGKLMRRMKISRDTRVDKEQKETIEQENSKDYINMSIGNKRGELQSRGHE